MHASRPPPAAPATALPFLRPPRTAGLQLPGKDGCGGSWGQWDAALRSQVSSQRPLIMFTSGASDCCNPRDGKEAVSYMAGPRKPAPATQLRLAPFATHGGLPYPPSVPSPQRHDILYIHHSGPVHVIGHPQTSQMNLHKTIWHTQPLHVHERVAGRTSPMLPFSRAPGCSLDTPTSMTMPQPLIYTARPDISGDHDTTNTNRPYRAALLSCFAVCT